MEQWQLELNTALKSVQDINKYFDSSFAQTNYPVLLPQFIARKIKKKGITSALAKQFLPHALENEADGMRDPIADSEHQTSHQIIHRYKSRVLFMPTSRCPIICRYCFRKNELYDGDQIFDTNFNETLRYLNEHSEINEVIFSGGDPLILSNAKLKNYLDHFSEIKHIKYIRFHTRFPVIIPSRVNHDFIKLLKSYENRFSKIVMVVHTNHPDEFSSDFFSITYKLSQLQNVELISQSVFLKGVNDNTETLKELFSTLSDNGVKPYYIHHPDPAKGTLHYGLELETTKTIYRTLRNELPGWQIPHYMIEKVGGQGKTWALNV